MPSYQVNYQIVSDFMVVVEADSEDEAREMVGDAVTPATLIYHAGGEAEPEWIESDVSWDTIEVSAITP